MEDTRGVLYRGVFGVWQGSGFIAETCSIKMCVLKSPPFHVLFSPIGSVPSLFSTSGMHKPMRSRRTALASFICFFCRACLLQRVTLVLGRTYDRSANFICASYRSCQIPRRRVRAAGYIHTLCSSQHNEKNCPVKISRWSLISMRLMGFVYSGDRPCTGRSFRLCS